MAKFKFNDIEVEYDDAYIKSYPMIKALVRRDIDEPKFYGALERLYLGRDEEYSEKLGFDMNKWLELLEATFKDARDADKDVKN